MRHALALVLAVTAGCADKEPAVTGATEPQVPVLSTSGPDIELEGARQDTRPLEVPIGAGFEVLGACSYLERIQCWDLDGSPSSQLEKKVLRRLEEEPDQASFIIAEGKCRLLVSEYRQGSHSKEPTTLLGASMMGTAGNNMSPRAGHVLLTAVSAAQDQSELTAKLTKWRTAGDASLRLKPGAVAKIGSMTLTLSGIDVSRAPTYTGNIPNPRRFELLFDVSGQPSESRVTLTPIGLDGKRVESVDTGGNPVRFKDLKPPRSATPSLRQHYVFVQAPVRLKTGQPGKATARIHVQPIKLSHLEVALEIGESVKTLRVPLEPK